MAKIKNTGHQPRGFIQADGSNVTIPPGGEAEVDMTEADFKNLQKIMEGHDDPKPFEISGSHEAKAEKKKKEEADEAHSPAQSTEPPAAPIVATPAPTQQQAPPPEKPKQQAAASKER
jgi:hypothetical protein